MDLKDVVVKQVPVKLARLKDEIVINPPNIADEEYFRNEIGSEELTKLFTELHDIPLLMKVVFRLLTYESKKMIAETQIFDIDENGREVELEARPFEKLAYIVSGMNEVALIMQALIEAKGMSLPDQSQKKTRPKKKKTVSHGQKSLT